MIKKEVVTLVLTDEQKSQLSGLLQTVLRAYADGSKGALIGQVFPDSGEMKIFFISNTQAKQMYKVVNKSDWEPDNA